MARGWESKTAEEQVEQNNERRAEVDGAAQRKVATAGDASRARERQLLELKRERILSEKTSHPARRSALQAALADIEREITELI
jgi:hypothetical protein